ncbi:MAG: hypothetical protein RL367_1840 [Pseudomonadota bacterium]
MAHFRDQAVAIPGTGSGIGRVRAQNLAARGAQLGLADFNQTSLQKTASQRPGTTRATCSVLDVSSREQDFAFADQAVADFGRAGIIINNAGTPVMATVKKVIAVNAPQTLAVPSHLCVRNLNIRSSKPRFRVKCVKQIEEIA